MKWYLPEVVADQHFQKLLLKLLQGGVQGEEEVMQVPCGGLLKARLPQGITWKGRQCTLSSVNEKRPHAMLPR